MGGVQVGMGGGSVRGVWRVRGVRRVGAVRAVRGVLVVRGCVLRHGVLRVGVSSAVVHHGAQRIVVV